jgi:phosphatidylserine/phosphatidylglycerophosphate/cardiolipin synthase-like enzyme
MNGIMAPNAASRGSAQFAAAPGARGARRARVRQQAFSRWLERRSFQQSRAAAEDAAGTSRVAGRDSRARRSIFRELYLAEDEVGREFVAALTAKAREGVRVLPCGWMGALGAASRDLWQP